MVGLAGLMVVELVNASIVELVGLVVVELGDPVLIVVICPSLTSTNVAV
jgi:hypothetical protein